MNIGQARSSLQKLKHRYLMLRVIEISFFSMSAAIVAFVFAGLPSMGFTLKIFLSSLTGVAVVIFLSLHYGLFRLSNRLFTSYLNQRFSLLGESVDLILTNEQELSPLQQVQKNKTLQLLDQILPDVKLPHKVIPSVLVFIACTVLYFALPTPTTIVKANTKSFEKVMRSNKAASSVSLTSLSAFISPPHYTQYNSFESVEPNLTLPENSEVKWSAQFSGEPTDVKIFFFGKDSVSLAKKTRLEYSLVRQISESGFYQIQWKDGGKIVRSDFYKIESIKDQPPKIAVKDLNQFTKLKYTDQLSVSVNSELTDDYGLTDAQIVATVSKGNGEGIKFREEKLKFTKPFLIKGKRVEASHVLDLKKLGLEPADELYFYVEAWDNKIPLPNHSRTETFFIAVQDTATEITSVDASLGVDLMPEYFRSQRQIIIDTEKLIRDKKKYLCTTIQV